eukprot:TRINITY_DN22146_c0_g1_i1.p1 TRINITY_DN22146_c0_g1~~TRINITY_DN22146_c0_g1_i1.p1  ORF type:complete len:469 (-),score=73.10 TRINITY_DN22146_c0_g1_i1:109-1515(-)
MPLPVPQESREKMPLAAGDFTAYSQQCYPPAFSGLNQTVAGSHEATVSDQNVGREPPWASPLAASAFVLGTPQRLVPCTNCSPVNESPHKPSNTTDHVERQHHEPGSGQVSPLPPGLDEDSSLLSPGQQTPRGKADACERRQALLLTTPPSGKSKRELGNEDPPSPLWQTPVKTGWRTAANRMASLTPPKPFAWNGCSHTGMHDSGHGISESRSTEEHKCSAWRVSDSCKSKPAWAERSEQEAAAFCIPQPGFAAASTFSQEATPSNVGRGRGPLPVGLQTKVSQEALQVRAKQGRPCQPRLSELLPAPGEQAVAVAASQAAQQLSAAAAAAWVAAAQAAAAAGSKSQSIKPAEPTAPLKASQPGEQAHCFNFTIRKADSTEMGLSVSHRNGQPPVVVNAVRPGGAVESWNKLCVGDRASRAVKEGDHLLSVNGVTDVPGILEEMRSKWLVRLEIWRPAGAGCSSLEK